MLVKPEGGAFTSTVRLVGVGARDNFVIRPGFSTVGMLTSHVQLTRERDVQTLKLSFLSTGMCVHQRHNIRGGR